MQRPTKFPCVTVGVEPLREVKSKDQMKTFKVQSMFYWEHEAESFPSKFDQFVDQAMLPGDYDVDFAKSMCVRDGRLGFRKLELIPRMAVAKPVAAVK